MRSHDWLSLLMVVLVAAHAPAGEAAHAKPDRGRVELIRDTWGTPHIFADTDAGAMYGLGYAAAEDRAFQMYYSLRIMQGRLAELIGAQKMPGRQTTAVDHDRQMRTFGFCRAAQEVVRHIDRESLALLEAYSDGVNDCMAANRGKRHYLFDQLGLNPEPWTPADCIVSWWHLGQFFAGDGTRELIHYRNTMGGGAEPMRPARGDAARGAPVRGGPAQRNSARNMQNSALKALPPDDAAAVIRREDVTDEWLGQTRDFMRSYGAPATRPAGEEGPKFSHAWVVGGGRTTTGSAVLVSDPQTPVRNPSLWYQFHAQGKSFNARGIGVPGSPIILIGWNQNVAWGTTALGADQADLFRLMTDPQHPDQYCFDGQWRPMTVRREAIKVRDGQDEPLVVRLTHLGPVATAFCFALPGEGEVALKRIPICETDRETVSGAIAMLRAKSAAEFMTALGGWRFPSVNVVFGDAKGDIGFSIAGEIPIRSSLEPLAGAAAMDGTSARFDWQSILPPQFLPRVINPKRGYLAIANHRAIGSFYPIPLGASTGWMGDTERSWRLRERLEMKTRFSPQDVLDIHNDSVNPTRRDIVRLGLHLRDVLQRELSEGATNALEHLRPWHAAGASSDLTAAGAELACEIPTFFRIMTTDLARIYGGGQSGLCYFLKTVDARLRQDAKADITPLEQAFIDDSLAAAWTSAVQRYGRDPRQWPAIARRQVTQRRLGYYETLDGFGSLDPERTLLMPALTCIDGGTIRSQAAQSYTQFVPLHDTDAALSMLPIGTSEIPDSPSRTSTMRLWAARQLHAAPLSHEKVEALAVSKRMLGIGTAASAPSSPGN